MIKKNSLKENLKSNSVILAVDTATSVASVAVLENGKTLKADKIDTGRTHSESLMPAIQDILRNVGKEIGEVDVFAVSEGPGSFTGLRIGVVAMKALAFGNRKRVALVPTLDAMAYGVGVIIGSGVICPMLDARNSQVYTAIYNMKGARTSEYMGIPVEELCDILKKGKKKVYITGELIEGNREILEKNGVDFEFIPEVKVRAKAVGKIASSMDIKKDLKKPEDANPYYLRQSQAERMKNG